jgi:hypothetical protein
MPKVYFIFATVLFFLFITQVSALVGVSVLSNVPVGFTPPPPPTSILDVLGFVVNNFVLFFKLMTVSSDFLIFGSVVITTFVIALLWAILELVRGI